MLAFVVRIRKIRNFQNDNFLPIFCVVPADRKDILTLKKWKTSYLFFTVLLSLFEIRNSYDVICWILQMNCHSTNCSYINLLSYCYIIYAGRLTYLPSRKKHFVFLIWIKNFKYKSKMMLAFAIYDFWRS